MCGQADNPNYPVGNSEFRDVLISIIINIPPLSLVPN